MNEHTEIVVKSSKPWLEQSSPVLASLILHLTILSVCAVATFSIPKEKSVSTMITDFTAIDTEQTEISLNDTDFQDESSSSAGTLVANDIRVVSQVVNSEIDAAPESEEAIPLSLSPSGVTTSSLTEAVSPIVQSSNLSEGGQGDGTGGDGDGSGEDDFFGLDLKGTSVVFVVDASSSMNFPHPGPAKTRFGRVKIELMKTIGRMNDSDRFFMIFFNDIAIPMPASTMVDATPENQQMYLQWMAPGKANGDTEPEAALHAALSLKPQVIYFLTDGRFNYSVVKAVNAANHSSVVINTLCFGDDQGEKFMKQLADSNGGVYRFIPDEPADEETKEAIEKSKPKPPTLTKLPLLN